MRGKIYLVLPILILAVIFAFSACQTSNADNTRAEFHSSPLPVQIPKETPTPVSNQNSAIRKIDFRNHTYPPIEDYVDFTLKNGEKSFVPRESDGIYLGETQYFDLNGDTEEEAILTLSIQTGGSSMPNLVYIYTLKNKKPKFLWGFMTGDRADGGLKRVYVENGELIVETFGDNKFENGKWKFNLPKNERGLACPTVYTKVRFRWNNAKFVVENKPELFDYDCMNQKSEN